jgi:hypothetical protein
MIFITFKSIYLILQITPQVYKIPGLMVVTIMLSSSDLLHYNSTVGTCNCSGEACYRIFRHYVCQNVGMLYHAQSQLRCLQYFPTCVLDYYLQP